MDSIPWSSRCAGHALEAVQDQIPVLTVPLQNFPSVSVFPLACAKCSVRSLGVRTLRIFSIYFSQLLPRERERGNFMCKRIVKITNSIQSSSRLCIWYPHSMGFWVCLWIPSQHVGCHGFHISTYLSWIPCFQYSRNKNHIRFTKNPLTSCVFFLLKLKICL